MLGGSVGRRGANHRADVRIVQELLRRRGYRVDDVDGEMSEGLGQAIERFQRDNTLPSADGRVDPRGGTIKLLWPVEYANPTGRPVRGRDGYGSGAYGASRGDRSHAGTDYVAVAGQNVVAPLSGRVIQEVRPYRSGVDSSLLSGLDIEASDGTTSRIFYIALATGIIGSVVAAGRDVIGTVLTLQTRYPGITDHVHVEIRPRGGEPVNPETVIPAASG